MLDKTFRFSLVLKGLDGVAELVGGIMLLFMSPGAIESLARGLTQHELAQDPHDFLANHLLHFAHATTKSGAILGALYLLSHGVVKIVLVLAVLKNKLWAYPWMIGFLALFIIYQVYRLGYKFTPALLILTIFDGFIVWLTWVEYRKHKLKATG